MRLLLQSIRQFSDDRCMQLAAALAFYATLSLSPLLMLLIGLAGLVMEPDDVEGEVAGVARHVMGPDGAEQLQRMMQSADDAERGLPAKLAGLVVLVVGATGVVAQLQDSLNQIWQIEPDPKQNLIKSFLLKRLLSLLLILAIASILLLSVLLTAALRLFADRLTDATGGVSFQFILSEGATLVMFTLLFAAMFKVLPDAKVKWRDVWFGAVVTALLFAVGKLPIGMYLGGSNLGSTYGAAGALVLVLFWTYYSSLIFFFGAELTQAWARRSGRLVEPEPGSRIAHTTPRRKHDD